MIFDFIANDWSERRGGSAGRFFAAHNCLELTYKLMYDVRGHQTAPLGAAAFALFANTVRSGFSFCVNHHLTPRVWSLRWKDRASSQEGLDGVSRFILQSGARLCLECTIAGAGHYSPSMNHAGPNGGGESIVRPFCALKQG